MAERSCNLESFSERRRGNTGREAGTSARSATLVTADGHITRLGAKLL